MKIPAADEDAALGSLRRQPAGQGLGSLDQQELAVGVPDAERHASRRAPLGRHPQEQPHQEPLVVQTVPEVQTPAEIRASGAPRARPHLRRGALPDVPLGEGAQPGPQPPRGPRPPAPGGGRGARPGGGEALPPAHPGAPRAAPRGPRRHGPRRGAPARRPPPQAPPAAPGPGPGGPPSLPACFPASLPRSLPPCSSQKEHPRSDVERPRRRRGGSGLHAARGARGAGRGARGAGRGARGAGGAGRGGAGRAWRRGSGT